MVALPKALLSSPYALPGAVGSPVLHIVMGRSPRSIDLQQVRGAAKRLNPSKGPANARTFRYANGWQANGLLLHHRATAAARAQRRASARSDRQVAPHDRTASAKRARTRRSRCVQTAGPSIPSRQSREFDSVIEQAVLACSGSVIVGRHLPPTPEAPAPITLP